jgi:MMP 1-O-methyltransferase
MLPSAVRRAMPERVRDAARLRALAVGTGLIPPRVMHMPGEAAALAELAATRRRAVEIGVYEGSSAQVLVASLPAGARLDLIDPFVDSEGLFAGWRGSAWATRRVVERAARARGDALELVWHVERSQDAGRRWSEPVDLVFIDGDHSLEACRSDWDLFSPNVAPGGVVVFHDARHGKPGGEGLPHDGGVAGPTLTVDALFRGPNPIEGWRIVRDHDMLVAVERTGS